MVRLSAHAQRRLSERGITTDEVETVHAKPHTTYADPDGKPCRIGDVGGRTIRIVLAPDDEEFVVTVMIQG
jgi:hypothetical protein